MTADRWCAGIGRRAHLSDGALVEVRAPIHVHLCTDCWHRWSQVREQPGRHHR